MLSLFRRVVVVPIVAVMFVCTSVLSVAQQPTTISGIVSDLTGAAVAGATVELVSGLVVTSSVATDSEGRYRVDGLQPGEYTVRVTAPGFQSIERRVNVSASGSAVADFRLGIQTKQESILVTAQYREQLPIDVPITINTLNSEEIARRGVTDLQSLSFAVPEMINVVTGMAQNRVMLRGIGDNGGNFPLVSLYLDQVAVNGPISRPVDIRPLDVERVEVLNGPQGTLYGDGAVGGTVRFLTKDPVIGKTSLTATPDVWVTNGGALSERLTGVTNLPLGDKVAFRIAGTYENFGGWIDAPTAGRKNINSGRLFQIRPKGLFKLTDKLSLIAMAQIHRNNVGSLSNGEDGNGNLILPAFAPTAVQPAHNDHELYSLTANWDLGSVKLLAVGSAFRNVADGGFYSPFAGMGRLARFDNRDKAQSGELRITSDDTGRWKWSVGNSYRHANFDSVTTFFQVGPANGTTSSNVNISAATPIKSDSWSFYGNTSFDLTHRLQVGGGLRYFTDKEIAPRVGQADQRFGSLDPRVYASFKLRQNWSVYASAAKGFRSGGFNSVNPAFPASYEPEKLWSYEVGTKFEALDGVLSGEIAGFTSRYTNMQSSVIATAIGLGYTGNVGRAHIKGLDWSFRVRPVAWFAFGTNGAVLDTKVVAIVPNSAYVVGDRLNYIPKYNFSHFAEGQADLKHNLKARIRIDYNRRGSSVFSQRTVNLTATGDTLHLLNAHLSLNRGRYGIEVYIENMLNDRGVAFPNPVQFGTRAVPRTIGIRIPVSFLSF